VPSAASASGSTTTNATLRLPHSTCRK
jgi:hypothetical protein